jgi:hypothetical protein
VLLRTILGLKAPDGGTIEVLGADLAALDDTQRRPVLKRLGVEQQLASVPPNPVGQTKSAVFQKVIVAGFHGLMGRWKDRIFTFQQAVLPAALWLLLFNLLRYAGTEHYSACSGFFTCSVPVFFLSLSFIENYFFHL